MNMGAITGSGAFKAAELGRSLRACERAGAWSKWGALLLLSAGCSAAIVSVRSAAAPEQPYRRLVVAAPITNPQARSEIEGAFVDVLTAEGVSATPSSAVFPSANVYTSNELVARLNEGGAQALLAVEVPEVVPLIEGWSDLLEQSGRGEAARAASNVGQTGASTNAPHSGLLRFELRLIDPDTKRTVWSAKTSAPLSEYPLTRLDRTYRWVARTSITRLRRDGLVQ